MTITARTLTWSLAPLAIAASTVISALQGVTGAAYACRVDCGAPPLHNHRAAACLPRAHTTAVPGTPALRYMREAPSGDESGFPPILPPRPIGIDVPLGEIPVLEVGGWAPGSQPLIVRRQRGGGGAALLRRALPGARPALHHPQHHARRALCRSDAGGVLIW